MSRTVNARRLQELLGTLPTSATAYQALADGVRQLIADGRVLPGTRLPSERGLTAQLGLSRTTVSRAYDVLRDGGYVRSRRGAGSVAAVPFSRSATRDRVLQPSALVEEGLIDLTCAAPASPPGIASAYELALAELPGFLSGTGYFPSGVPGLKERIARRYAERGLPTDPDQVIVTNGALSAVAILCDALVGPGERVLAETPGYPNTLATLRRRGARAVAAPVEPDGWDNAALARTIRSVRPAAAFLAPDFHNPTGALMTDAVRRDLADALRAARTVTVVDETLAEMSLDGGPMPAPMASYLKDAFCVGSASKTFWGGLRIGWIRSPRSRVGDLVATRLTVDLGAPLLEQLALAHLLERREEILAHHRQRLRESRTLLATRLTTALPEWRFSTPSGGLSLWCELPHPSSSRLVAAAQRRGVLLAAGPSFTLEGTHERFVRLPYTLAPETLSDAVDRIAAAVGELDRTPRGRRAPGVPVVA